MLCSLCLAVMLLIYLHLQWLSPSGKVKSKLFSLIFKVFHGIDFNLLFQAHLIFFRWKFCLFKTYPNIHINWRFFITCHSVSSHLFRFPFSVISFLNFSSELPWHLFMLILLGCFPPSDKLSCIVIYHSDLYIFLGCVCVCV